MLTTKQAKKTKSQETQAIRDEMDRKLQDQASIANKAETRVRQLEHDLREMQEKASKVSTPLQVRIEINYCVLTWAVQG